MNPFEREQIRHSEFFEAAIVNRSAGRVVHAGNMSAQFSRAEVVYWAIIGAQIGYLDRDYIRSLFSQYSGPVVSACESLREYGQFPFPLPKDWPAPAIELSKQGIFFVEDGDTDWLSDSDALPVLWKTFEHLMLLASENLLDDETHDFVDSIGWADTNSWNARREGEYHRIGHSFSESVESLQLGFANVVRQWRDELLLMSELFDPTLMSRAIRTPSKKLRRRDEGFVHRSSPDEISKAVVPFADACFFISRHRYNLSNQGVVERYFSYAGSLCQQAKDGSAGWLDLRRHAFSELRDLIALGEVRDSTFDMPRLWALFTQSDFEVQRDVTRPQKRRITVHEADEESSEDNEEENHEDESSS
jgi:hypothetical protein